MNLFHKIFGNNHTTHKEETKMDFTVFTEKGEFTFEEEREGIKKNTLESYEKSLNKKEGEQ